MAVSKYWGDERQPNAVYAVFLKKVRYVPPAGYEGLPHYRPIDPDSHFLEPELGADHLQWETIRERVIKAGSVDKLVESLIGAEDKMDSRHFNVFFATYRAYAQPEAVLDKLLSWYNSFDTQECGSKSSVTIQGSIRSILICWLDMYPEDFYDTDARFPLLARLVDFCRQHSLNDLKHKARKLRERFRRIAEEGGLSTQLPAIDRYVYALDYDPNDYEYAMERANLFDIGKENCVQIAEQLTFWDAVLFKEVRPYQCQGAIWGRRNKRHPDTVFSVRATIDQFNAVSQRVMTSVVLPECRPEFRAKIIEKWIDVARELRALKNFSSLKAVISSLQSEAVFRLKSAWSHVPKVAMAQFRELAAIYETDENGDEQKARSILEAEGTAKSSPLKRPQLIQNCRRTKSDVNLAESQGTVPYLGSFLTDLMMLDQAHSDFTEDGLVNFEKRRKEFEVLAKIRLFQSAARAYSVPMDQAFCSWFYYLPTLNENECYARSMEVERTMNSTPDMRRHPRHSNGIGNGSPSLPSKMSSFTKMFGHLSTNDDSPSSSSYKNWGAGQDSNDSGIHSEESWLSGNGTGASPSMENSVAAALLSRGKLLASPGVADLLSRSATAPSTPNSTISWRGGSEFNPYMHLSPARSSRGSNGSKGKAGTATNGHPTDTEDAPSNGDAAGPSSPVIKSKMAAEIADPRHMLMRRMNGHQQSTSSQTSSSSVSSTHSSSFTGNKNHSMSSTTTTSTSTPNGAASNGKPSLNFHLARVGLDDALQTEASGPNYKSIKVENGDKMATLLERALEKHMMDPRENDRFCLIQLLPDGSEFRLPDHCNPFYAVAPDPTSPMLNFILRRRSDEDRPPSMAPSAKKLNRQKRSNLLRWSSGYL